MGKRILIVSATSGNNFTLAGHIKEQLSSLNVESSILNLEELELPLFKPGLERPKENIQSILQLFHSADGFIFCSPEYNGGSTPILSNAITWVSTSSKDWREAFVGKSCIVATHSGGPATRFLTSFRSQCEHLGMVVMPRTIAVTSYNPFKVDSVVKTLKQLLDHI